MLQLKQMGFCIVGKENANMGKLIIGVNDLLTKKPQLASEWDYDKNGDLMPNQVSYGSKKIVWWICSTCGYSWPAQINSRSQGNGCRNCRYKKAVKNTIKRKLNGGKNTLAALNPPFLSEWDYSKNGDLTPFDVTPKSSKKVWWICRKCHSSFFSKIEGRTAEGKGCPVCAGIEVKTGINDLETKAPLIAEEWDYSKNGSLQPNQVTEKSSKVVSWKCKVCGHQWDAPVSSRTRGTGCPKCSRMFHTSLPEQIIYWYLSLYFKDVINEYHPDWLKKSEEIDIFIPSLQLGIEYDGEKWHKNKVIRDTEKGKTIIDNGVQLIRIREPNLEMIDDGSIVITIPQLDNNYSYIEGLLYELSKEINRRYNTNWIPCVNLEQDINAIRASLLRNQKQKSLAYCCPEIAKEWDYEKNQRLEPTQVTSGNDTKVFWKCSKCGYVWKASIGSRANGSGCPACAGLILQKGINDFQTMRPDKVGEWDELSNNGLKPEDVAYRSTRKVWWRCSKCGGKYPQRIADKSDGHGCPICTGKMIVKGINDLSTNNSKLAEEWDYEKNVGITPDMIAPQSNQKVWWICSKCGHSWPATVYSRNGNGRGCPKCGKQKRKNDK